MAQTPKIGAFVLETLTTGMYTNPLDALREFVQNATDSILQAEREGLITKNAGRLEVIIDPRSHTLTIRDNGVGIPQAEVYSCLINIGMSQKKIEINAGFRGIGRLAGIAYCRILRFRTSFNGEAIVSTVSLDCESLRKAILPAMRQVEELTDVLVKNSTLTHDSAKPQEHFFEVILEGITDAAEDFLDHQKMESYLRQTAPVNFDAQRFTYAPQIRDWTERQGIAIPIVNLIIKTPEGDRQVFKPYRTHYKTSRQSGTHDIHVRGVRFYPETLTSDSLFWVWYGDTDLLGMIDDDSTAGLRLRKNNISIGGADRITEIFSELARSNDRFNAYYIGEVHILVHDAIPNARRDGFENIGSWPQIRKELAEFLRERVADIRHDSEVRNRPPQKIIASAKKVISEAQEELEKGFISLQRQEEVQGRLARELTRARESFECHANSPEAQIIEPVIKQLEEIHQALERECVPVAKKLNPTLDRKQRKIIQEILDILSQTLEEPQFKKARDAILARYQITNGN